MTESTGLMLPRYQCHKQVHALKIAGIQPVVGGSAIITPAEGSYAPFTVDADYVSKHKPQQGGFYVVYDDGYKSYSPAQAFEEGYTRIVDDAKPFDWAALQKLRKESP